MSRKTLKNKLLVIQLKSKDKEAFARVYDLYVVKIYRYIFFKVSNQNEAQDLTSEVFLKAWEYINSPSFKQVNNLNGFLYRIARNIVVDYYRQKKNRDIYEGDILGFDDGRIEGKQTRFERWVVKPLGEWDCTCEDYYCSQQGVGFSIEGYDGYYRTDGSVDTHKETTTILGMDDKCEVIGNIYENPELLKP